VLGWAADRFFKAKSKEYKIPTASGIIAGAALTGHGHPDVQHLPGGTLNTLTDSGSTREKSIFQRSGPGPMARQRASFFNVISPLESPSETPLTSAFKV